MENNKIFKTENLGFGLTDDILSNELTFLEYRRMLSGLVGSNWQLLDAIIGKLAEAATEEKTSIIGMINEINARPTRILVTATVPDKPCTYFRIKDEQAEASSDFILDVIPFAPDYPVYLEIDGELFAVKNAVVKEELAKVGDAIIPEYSG